MPSPANMYAELMRHDLCSFIHRSFLELHTQTPFLPNWHIELLAAKLEEVRRGTCKRLIINIPPRHLKSHTTSIVFPAWLLGHEAAKQILCVSYAKDLSDKMARDSRSLMMSSFYQALFDTRISGQRDTVAEFETNEGGFRLSTSIGGVLTGRGADIIIIDDPLKADDALSETRRGSVNDWYDNTLRSRLNSQQTGSIIIVMQRLHADDLVAHVQEHETWDLLAFAAIAEQDETYEFSTPFGRRRVQRASGEALQPSLLPLPSLNTQRRSMTEYNFVAQYQQNPQPASGNIVKREWLKYYGPPEKPERFDQILQSWDTANKDTELSNFSVCTTWGIKDQRMFLLDVLRRKMDFPTLKRAIKENAAAYGANVVLIEDQASGTSLIAELRSQSFPIVQAAPKIDGTKVLRLMAQTAKIEGGFVLFPIHAHWLEAYLHELLTFPNSKNDDQVDSTVYALAWSTSNSGRPGIIQWTKDEADRPNKKVRAEVPPGISHWEFPGKFPMLIPPDRIIEVTEEELRSIILHGGKRVN